MNEENLYGDRSNAEMVFVNVPGKEDHFFKVLKHDMCAIRHFVVAGFNSFYT